MSELLLRHMHGLKSPDNILKQLIDPGFKFPIVLWKRCMKTNVYGLDEKLEEFYRNHKMLTAFAMRCLRRELRNLTAAEVAGWLLAPDKSLFLTYLKKQATSESTRAFLHAVLKPTIVSLATGGAGGRQELSHIQLANITLDFLRQLSYNTGVCPLKIREAFVLLHRALGKRHRVILNQTFCTAFAVFVICPALADPSIVGFNGPISAVGRNNIQRFNILLQFIASGSDSYIRSMAAQDDAFARISVSFLNSASYFFDQLVLYLTDKETLKSGQIAVEANAAFSRRKSSEKDAKELSLQAVLDFCVSNKISLLPPKPRARGVSSCTMSTSSSCVVEESCASFTASDSEESAATATPDVAGAMSPDLQYSSRTNSLTMKLSLSSSSGDDAGSSDDDDLEDPVVFLHAVESSPQQSRNKHSGPIDVCLNSSAFAETYASGMAESSEVITTIEISDNDDALKITSSRGRDEMTDSVVANAGNSDVDWSELSARSHGSTAGNSRQSDIDWDDLSMSTNNTYISSSNRRVSHVPNMTVIQETSFSSSSLGSAEEDLEDQASRKSVEELTEKLIESFPMIPSAPAAFAPPAAPKTTSPIPSLAELRSWRRRSKSDTQLNVSKFSVPAETMSNESDEEISSSQEPRSQSTMFAPGTKPLVLPKRAIVTDFSSVKKIHSKSKKNNEKDMEEKRSHSLKKPSTKSISPVGSHPSTPGSSPRSDEPQRSSSASKAKSRKRKQSRTDGKNDPADSDKSRIPLLALLRVASHASSSSKPSAVVSDSEESSGESTPESIAPKRSKRSIDMLKQSADKIDNIVETMAAKIAPGEEKKLLHRHARQISSDLHKSHGEELEAISRDLDVENDILTPRNHEQPTILSLPDELWHLRLVDAQDGVEKSLEELTKSSKASPFVLVFLRQFGCIFCRRRISELIQLKPLLDAKGVQLITIGNGSLKTAKKLIAESGITFPVLLDKSQKSYRLMHLQRGIRAALLNTKTVAKIGETFKMGFKQGRSSGDQLQLGGFFVCQGTRVTFAHPDRFSGDTVDASTIEAVCEN